MVVLDPRVLRDLAGRFISALKSHCTHIEFRKERAISVPSSLLVPGDLQLRNIFGELFLKN